MQTQKLTFVVATTFGVLFALIVSYAHPGQVQLSWQAPTTDADGSPLTGLAGYKLYYGQNSRQVSGSYTFTVGVGNGNTYTLTGLTDGQLYYFAVTAYDTLQNESAYSNEVSAVSSSPSPSPTGLVAAYNFNEGSGSTVTDRSGTGNHGTISSATWTTSGRYGKALVFNGTNSWVTIPDAPALDLTTGMTLEAWVYPTANLGNWSTVIMKEQPGWFTYVLYASSPNNRPHVFILTSAEQGLAGSSAVPLNTWSHLAGTYDGSFLKLYRNGVEVSRKAQSGMIATSSGPVRLGGNSSWGSEWFKGRLDEVRVYNRALSASEIASDKNTPVK